ncbi:ATP-binding protein [Mucilaginibacter terrae]|uniref:ATP-binding protein n=1 Tax=Mucilaginibacter terrae TaxID=1955052 RepID=UPI00363C174B
MILYKQEHYRMAAQYFKNSFQEIGACEITFKNFYRQQELLNNAGISYNKINELDSALLYFNKSLTYINNPPNKNFIVADSLLKAAKGVVYGNQASVYIKKQNYDKAKQLLKKSIAINAQKNYDNNDALLSELKLLHLYEKQNQTDSMPSLLNIVEQQLKTINNKEALADWNFLKAVYFERRKQLPQAIRYFKQYDSIQAIVNNKVIALKANDIAEQLKRFEKDYEVDQLKKTNEQKNWYLTIVVMFFIMALIILLLIYFNWQKSKTLLTTLGELNQQIHIKNAALEKALENLEFSSQEKDRILRTVAHDLRNPIGGIASLTGLVIEDEECNTEQKTYLSLVKDTAYNTLELINEILEATTSNKDNLVKQKVEINTLLNNSVELLRFKASEKNQQITLHLLDMHQEMLISREKIWRVISNLISNAIKFSPTGGTVQVMIVKTNQHVEISVHDTGIGIPAHLKDKVFNMFTEAKRPGTMGEKSFGLGLSICRQIIEMHNGQIWFESNEQTGTTFYIRLPLYSQELQYQHV